MIMIITGLVNLTVLALTYNTFYGKRCVHWGKKKLLIPLHIKVAYIIMDFAFLEF